MSGRSRAAKKPAVPVELIYADLERRVHFPPHLDVDVDFTKWSDDRLREAVLPPRPPSNLKEARRFWEEALSKLDLVPLSTVREAFKIETRARQRTRRAAATGRSGSWSGAVLEIPDGWTCQSVYASWEVPFAKPGVPPAPPGGNYSWHGSCWIGLDGSLPGSVTLPQTGSAHCVHIDDPLTPTASLWWQWWIADDIKNVPITLPIPVSPGDRVVALLSVIGELRVNFFMKNLESGQSFSIDVDAPSLPGLSPVPIEQETMEWIVERQTEIGGDELLPFADYCECYFKACATVLLDANGLDAAIDLSDPNTLEMADWTDMANPGQIISTYTDGDFETVGVQYET